MVDEYCCAPDEFSAVKYSGRYASYCGSALNWGERVRRRVPPDRGDCGGDGKDEAGAVVAADDGDVYAADAGAGSGRRAVLGDFALVHSSSGSCDAGTGASYNAVGLNDGGRGRGACRRGSGAYPTARPLSSHCWWLGPPSSASLSGPYGCSGISESDGFGLNADMVDSLLL